MNLHRALIHEWSDTPAQQRTALQRVAASSNGIITPGNAISLLGLIIVLIGVWQLFTENIFIGTGLIVAGRLADIADGVVANRTKTKSPVGEAVDASVDKLEALIILVAVAALALAPIYVILLLALHHLANTALYILARKRGGRVHPNAIGKISTVLEWVALAGYIISNAASISSNQASIVVTLSFIFFITAIAMFVISTVEYVKQYQSLGKNS